MNGAGSASLPGVSKMYDSNMSPSLEPVNTLEQDLQNELKNWYELLQRFYGYHDDGLEFDIDAAGEEGRKYVRMLEELQEDSARSIAIIKSRAESPEATATSLRELRKISQKVRFALREREKLRIIGSRALEEMLAFSY